MNFKNIESKFLASIAQLAQFETLRQKEKDHLNDFAKCLTERGLKFYGVSWDGYTRNQKIIFREAVKYLPYIECGEPESKQMTFECLVAEIKTFPTWEFQNRERLIGEISLEKLQELSGCPLEK